LESTLSSKDKNIKIRCKGSIELPLEDLKPFQGNLKSLSDKSHKKLRRRILSSGFRFPIFVWKSPEGDNFILDGHQRVKTLLKMVETDGYKIDKIPCAEINADSYDDAKEQILAATSAYGKIEHQGLYEFMQETRFDLDMINNEFRLPEIDLKMFEKEYYKDDDSDLDTKEIDESDQEFLIVIDCKDENEQAEVFEDMKQKGLKCKIM